MPGKKRQERKVQNDLEARLDRAEDPAATVREIDDRIRALRGEIRREEAREQRERKRHEKIQADVSSWALRAEKAVDKGRDDEARQALSRKKALRKEVAAQEKAWWNAVNARKRLEETLAALEDRVQEARRRKESILARSRRKRSSSDFLVLPREPAPESASSEAVEKELNALKRRHESDREA